MRARSITNFAPCRVNTPVANLRSQPRCRSRFTTHKTGKAHSGPIPRVLRLHGYPDLPLPVKTSPDPVCGSPVGSQLKVMAATSSNSGPTPKVRVSPGKPLCRSSRSRSQLPEPRVFRKLRKSRSCLSPSLACTPPPGHSRREV